MRSYCVIVLAVLLSGCTQQTLYGDCVGFSKDDRDPSLRYELNIINAVVAIVLAETVIVPIVWATDYMYCPIGIKEKSIP